MYKVLIVDDEEMIRNGIKNAIPWIDFEVSGVRTAASGEEAEEIFATFSPDIVLTDIRMPGLSGLELLQKLIQTKKGVKVIILSGYDDFSYAQTAIKEGAFDYLLKTTDMAGLTKVIRKAVDEVKKEEEKNEMEQKIRTQLDMSLPLLKYKYLNELIHGGTHLDELIKKMAFVDIKLKSNLFIVGVVEIDNFLLVSEGMTEEERLVLKFGLLNIMEELLGEQALCFESKYEEFVCIYYCDEQLTENENCEQFILKCKQIQNAISKHFDTDISIGVSIMGDSLYAISMCYEEAKSTLEHKLFSGKGSIIHTNDVAYLTTFHFQLSLEQEKKLVSGLRVGDKKQVFNTLEDIFNQISSRKDVNLSSFHKICVEILGIVSRVLSEFNKNIEELFEGNFVYFEEIKKYETFDETKQRIISIFEKAIQYILDTKILKTKKIIQAAKEYIDEHYNEELTLNKIANVIHISPNYFSSLFSNEIGQSFLEYVASLRIEKAKQLLADRDAKAYEVGEKVGYANPYYFSRIFKKCTGMSPSEYKDSLKNR